VLIETEHGKPLRQLLARCPAVKNLVFTLNSEFFKTTKGLDSILAGLGEAQCQQLETLSLK